MCGRFVSTEPPERLAEIFGIAGADLPPTLGERWNIPPTSSVYAVTSSRAGDGRRLDVLRWGLVPSWAKDPSIGQRLANARAETVAEKPSFRTSLRTRRCIVPMTGFYEWRSAAPDAPRVGGRPPAKQPVYAHRRDGRPLAVAGLWSTWRLPGAAHGDADGVLRTCAVITTAANAVMSPIHDRMPVVLPQAHWDEWLDAANDDVGALCSLLVPAEDDVLQVVEVSTAVNSVRNDGPELITPQPALF